MVIFVICRSPFRRTGVLIADPDYYSTKTSSFLFLLPDFITSLRRKAYGEYQKRKKEEGAQCCAQSNMESRNPTQNGAARAADPAQTPGSLLPNTGEGGPAFSGDDPAQTPAIPLPNPGEGGPVFPGVQPLPSTPGFVIPNAAVRFVNASHGYPPLRISIGGTRVVTLLSPGEASCYSRIAAGVKTVSVIGSDGYIYLQMQLNFRAGQAYIVAIANRSGGLSLTQAEDTCFV